MLLKCLIAAKLNLDTFSTTLEIVSRAKYDEKILFQLQIFISLVTKYNVQLFPITNICVSFGGVCFTS